MSSSLRMPSPSSGTGLGLLGGLYYHVLLLLLFSLGMVTASGFGASPVFGSGGPMFGSVGGLSQQRPPPVSMANTSQRYVFTVLDSQSLHDYNH